MEFSRQEYWSGLPCPSPGDLPHPGIEPGSPVSPALEGRFLTTVPLGSPAPSMGQNIYPLTPGSWRAVFAVLSPLSQSSRLWSAPRLNTTSRLCWFAFSIWQPGHSLLFKAPTSLAFLSLCPHSCLPPASEATSCADSSAAVSSVLTTKSQCAWERAIALKHGFAACPPRSESAQSGQFKTKSKGGSASFTWSKNEATKTPFT